MACSILHLRLLFQQSDKFQAIHVGKIQFQQNQVRMELLRFPQPTLTGHRDQRFQPRKHHLLHQELRIVRLFFDNEDRLGGLARHVQRFVVPRAQRNG